MTKFGATDGTTMALMPIQIISGSPIVGGKTVIVGTVMNLQAGRVIEPSFLPSNFG